VPAAVALLNRGYGLPVQPIEGEGAQSLTLLHLIAAKEVSDHIERILARNDTTPLVIEGEPVSPKIASDAPLPKQQSPLNGQHRPDDEPSDLRTPALE
jgi:hypothetical protein